MEETNRLDDNQPVFEVEFYRAYTFRNLIEYLKATNMEGNFIFTKDKIIYRQTDASETILNDLVINSADLTKYKYNHTKESITAGINLADFRRVTKSIGKKDVARLYMLRDPQYLYLTIAGSNNQMSNRDNISIIRTKNIGEVDFDLYKFQRKNENPNCTIPSLDFSKMCASMKEVGCSKIKVIGMNKGITFEGILSGNVIGKIDRFGDCDENEYEQLIEAQQNNKNNWNLVELIIEGNEISNNSKLTDKTLDIKISTMKKLMKLHNLSPESPIKLYIEENSPLKIMCNIGSYGTLSIYIRDEKNN